MTKEMKQIGRHTKWHACLIKGTTILAISTALQANNCRGKVSSTLHNSMPDLMVAQTDEKSFEAMIENTMDISIPIKTKTNDKPRHWLYAAVSSGDIAKVKCVLNRLNNDIRDKKAHKNKDFQNLPDTSSGKTALGKAIEKDYTKIINALLENPHIVFTAVDKEQRSPLHMAAIHNKKEGFKLVWYKIQGEEKDKAHATKHLFEKDNQGHSVFASAYLPEPRFNLLGSHANFNMFKDILNIIKDNLDENHLNDINKEIMDLKHKDKISKKYAAKLHYAVSEIKHPKPPTSPKK